MNTTLPSAFGKSAASSPFSARMVRNSRAAHITCSMIWPLVRSWRNPSLPVAQKVQAIGQPDCEDTHTVARSGYTISTASTGDPSGNANNALRVNPSSPFCCPTCFNVNSVASRANRSRNAFGKSVISSIEPTALTYK